MQHQKVKERQLNDSVRSDYDDFEMVSVRRKKEKLILFQLITNEKVVFPAHDPDTTASGRA